MQPPEEQPTANQPPKIEFSDPAELRPHALHKFIPGPDLESAEWHSFVDALSGLGPEGTPPIYITPEGFIMDGERRWRAARQLQWPQIACIIRPEWEAALLIVESLFGQRCLTQGAKAYLSLPLLPEYTEAAETRRLMWLKNGVKILQKPPKSPLPPSWRSRHDTTAAAQLAEHLGVAERTVQRAITISKAFELEHKFEFQDGRELTLREYFEPRILDPEHPMGLDQALKGCGEFVDGRGNPVKHPPPERNTRLRYIQCAWDHWVKGCDQWKDLPETEREQASGIIAEKAQLVCTEALLEQSRIWKSEIKKRKKANQRKPRTVR